MKGRGLALRRGSWLACALILLLAACGATPTPGPTPTPTPSQSPGRTETPTATPAVLPGPITSLPPGCSLQASGRATHPRVSIRDVIARSFADYDALILDFDRGLPAWDVATAEPPFTADPSGLPLEVSGTSFFSIVLQGASIVDDEFQPVYEGPTDLQPDLTRIEHVVLAGDFEAVSSWLVGLRGPACLAVQAFGGDRLVIAFVDRP